MGKDKDARDTGNEKPGFPPGMDPDMFKDPEFLKKPKEEQERIVLEWKANYLRAKRPDLTEDQRQEIMDYEKKMARLMHEQLEKASFMYRHNILWGLSACAALAYSASLATPYLSHMLPTLGGSSFPLAPTSVALLTGFAIRNLPVPAAIAERLYGPRTDGLDSPVDLTKVKPFLFHYLIPGLKVSSDVLKIGIALLGFKLSLYSLLSASMYALPLTALIIYAALKMGYLLGSRFMINWDQSLLISVGTAICGFSAITAMAPVVRASKEHFAIAAATILVYGTFGMLFYPLLAYQLFGGHDEAVGFFLGTAIHDTAQVLAAGMTYSEMFDAPAVVEHATMTKLARNMWMPVVLVNVALNVASNDRAMAASRLAAQVAEERRAKGDNIDVGKVATAAAEASERHPIEPEAMGIRPEHANYVQALLAHTPGFVLVFLGAVTLRSVGDLLASFAMGPLPEAVSAWTNVVNTLGGSVSTGLLMIGMAGFGLSTKLQTLRNVDSRVFYFALLLVGFVTTLSALIAWGVFMPSSSSSSSSSSVAAKASAVAPNTAAAPAVAASPAATLVPPVPARAAEAVPSAAADSSSEAEMKNA